MAAIDRAAEALVQEGRTDAIGRGAWLVPPRAVEAELLDQGHGSPQDVRENLAEMWRINRFLGGLRALTAHLDRRLPQDGSPVTVADLGTGSGEMAAYLARRLRRRGHAVRVLAVDWAARHLAIAAERGAGPPDVLLLRADAAQLPLPAQGVDFVISSLFLHHFEPDAAADLLRTAFACARRALIMSDLVRGWLPLAAFRLVQPAFARNYLTRHDGALSVRRAYTPDELRALAYRAGLEGARVHTHWPWRMTLVIDR